MTKSRKLLISCTIAFSTLVSGVYLTSGNVEKDVNLEDHLAAPATYEIMRSPEHIYRPPGY
ncbi:hypothetical protein [Jeotgalibacillus sp. R-1-5s-1]|uniref:hypothetical protein n=1 Tax=Jeotgalibacillus sp. R-1-5s-1 TaxID=2555897 RepID=UPI00106BADFD|nr:hypothetical protein [Jeotgalibacillus sp. R-1-5s-1]TFD97037.1 hypothetical protein E2491_10095 [Jeotgalibacillus sp. R-1-5s-1]